MAHLSERERRTILRDVRQNQQASDYGHREIFGAIYPIYGVGCCRIVYDAGSHLIKVADSLGGVRANRIEAIAWSIYDSGRYRGLPVQKVFAAACEPFGAIWVEKLKFTDPLQYYADPWIKPSESAELPWLDLLDDGRQIGWSTIQNSWVVYDLSHEPIVRRTLAPYLVEGETFDEEW